ncbi:MAG: tRNA pseudouridine(55) synthase TruB [Spirochaetales bacterium]|nr:tRNA pseudouridine(55) synthase TruB [Spirochaetales bacterium]
MTSGIILIDKPAGLTSFQALGQIKKKLGHRKIGHTGTLDKFASGLIVVLAGSFTRLNPYFTGLDKTYKAKMTFGKETSTLDPEGDIIKEAPIPEFGSIEKVIPDFIGEIMQIPPDFSAVHIDGKRAYKRKLAGEELEIPPRKIRIDSFDILSWDSPDLDVRISCSKGTYIRSIARDIGSATQSCCYVSELSRESVGLYKREKSITPDVFSPETDLVSGREVFELLPEIDVLEVTKESIPYIRNGVPFKINFTVDQDKLQNDGNLALYDDETFLGLLEVDKGNFKYGFLVGTK